MRRTNEAARARYGAAEEALRGITLILVSDVSRAYFELLGLRYRLEIAHATVQAFSATLNLFTILQQGGLGNVLQTSRATADTASATAGIPEIERQIALRENQISVLLGKNPSPIQTKLKLLEEGGSAKRPGRLTVRPSAAPAGCACGCGGSTIRQCTDRTCKGGLLPAGWTHYIFW